MPYHLKWWGNCLWANCITVYVAMRQSKHLPPHFVQWQCKNDGPNGPNLLAFIPHIRIFFFLRSFCFFFITLFIVSVCVRAVRCVCRLKLQSVQHPILLWLVCTIQFSRHRKVCDHLAAAHIAKCSNQFFFLCFFFCFY